MQLIDKGYYDYDYEIVAKLVWFEDTVMSDEEVKSKLRNFGWGYPKTDDIEGLQKYVINELNSE